MRSDIQSATTNQGVWVLDAPLTPPAPGGDRYGTAL